VPKRLSIVGFDDLEESTYSSPPLTTLRQDFKELGNRAMNLLLSEISGTSTKKLDRLIPELIKRGSTAAVPKL
jgi:DNA-binding LacI/PurR family transcriptional regulator